MRFRSHDIVVLSVLLAAVPFGRGWAQGSAAESLRAELERLVEPAQGVVGLAAIHLETGRQVVLNGDVLFPMASTYKVPIAAQLLSRVDRGEVRLDTMIDLSAADRHPGSGMISELLDDPGVSLSLRNLLELMLLISDNSATDLVLRAAGGAARVTERMRALGIEGIRVDRPTVDLLNDYVGLDVSRAHGIPADSLVTLWRALSEERREEAAEAFDRDTRDTATPLAMAKLLQAIWDGHAMSAESRDLLLDIMTRSTTGTARIKGKLPGHVSVAHKTGTVGGTTNDVGIITLPGDAGHVALAAFVKESEADGPDREAVIANMARAVYDFFLFTP